MKKCKMLVHYMTKSSDLCSALPMKVLVSTWWENEYCLDVCHGTNDTHSGIYWALKELRDVRCL